MKKEQNDRKHLTPRQIVNRYRKGEYIGENIEYVSSVISSCTETFDSVAVPFSTSLIEKVYENITIARALYERQKKGDSTDCVEVPDYPQLKDILLDLSYPPLWESMRTCITDIGSFSIMKERGLIGKYKIESNITNVIHVASGLSFYYLEVIKKVGLSVSSLEVVLFKMANL